MIDDPVTLVLSLLLAPFLSAGRLFDLMRSG